MVRRAHRSVSPNSISIGSAVWIAHPDCRTRMVQSYSPGGAHVHYNTSINSHYKNLHYKKPMSSHCKINIIGDPSLPIINLHYKRSISNNEKRFSIITQKNMTIPQKSLLYISPPNISSGLYHNPNKPYIF